MFVMAIYGNAQRVYNWSDRLYLISNLDMSIMNKTIMSHNICISRTVKVVFDCLT